ncbi:hypothetical protein G9A89_010927 [Geosiphon pyriformis]|nr:hypothetical protein G9A89_010927 [Geosiphon pyriformis]
MTIHNDNDQYLLVLQYADGSSLRYYSKTKFSKMTVAVRRSMMIEIRAYCKRETPILGTPLEYVKLYSECWDGEPTKRLNIDEVSQRLLRIEWTEIPTSTTDKLTESNFSLEY